MNLIPCIHLGSELKIFGIWDEANLAWSLGKARLNMKNEHQNETNGSVKKPAPKKNKTK